MYSSYTKQPISTIKSKVARIVATQSSPFQLLKVRSRGNNVIIVHVISADAQIHRRRKHKVILVPVGHTRSVRLAGKSKKIEGGPILEIRVHTHLTIRNHADYV